MALSMLTIALNMLTIALNMLTMALNMLTMALNMLTMALKSQIICKDNNSPTCIVHDVCIYIVCTLHTNIYIVNN